MFLDFVDCFGEVRNFFLDCHSRWQETFGNSCGVLGSFYERFLVPSLSFFLHFLVLLYDDDLVKLSIFALYESASYERGLWHIPLAVLQLPNML